MDSGAGKVRLPVSMQVGMVVKDVDRVIRFYQSAFGIGPWVVREGESDSRAGGRTYKYRTKTAFAPLGPVTLELFQVTQGVSPVHALFSDKGREGVHHLGFYGNKEARDRITEELALKGIGLVQERSTNAFLDTGKTGGVFLEVIENSPPTFEAPKPTGKVKLPSSLQLGIVVKDIDEVMHFYQSVLGIGPWEKRQGRSEVKAGGQTYRFKTNLAFGSLGALNLELFQLVEGRSPAHSHWVDEGREGVHHFGFYVTKEEKERILSDLAEIGVGVVQDGKATGASCTFFDTEAVGGVLFELITRSSDA
jgi:catechol 2,3-dioxygenase-like lactoylglutathione lyase family enzyme